MLIDLHNHTIFSYDSVDSPELVIENAIKHGIDVVGITDHQFTIGDKLSDYFMYIQHCKIKYADQIRVLCGLEIGTRPKPDDLIADATEQFDYVLFESLDSPKGAMDFYEFLEWRKLFKCKVGLAHTDIFVLAQKYGLDILAELKKADIFWEINTSGNYNYYYDLLTNPEKRKIISDSKIEISVGSDTHWVGEYRFNQIKRANELLAEMKNPMP